MTHTKTETIQHNTMTIQDKYTPITKTIQDKDTVKDKYDTRQYKTNTPQEQTRQTKAIQGKYTTKSKQNKENDTVKDK